MANRILLSSIFILLFFFSKGRTQNSVSYSISFPNAVHHEGEVSLTISNLEHLIVKFRMSRSSPGRYALHEFAKNVYRVKAVDSQGNELSVHRPNPHEWEVSGHDGTITISYTLFANRGDGTYAQIDETHAHLNMPATFIYASQYQERPIEVDFRVRKDLNWSVATQLKPLTETRFFAPNLQYFMDSPTEISDYAIREHQRVSNGKTYNIRFVLHHDGTDQELDQYAQNVWKVVEQAQQVYGELPEFDYDTYTFLACYIPHASGDGMEHRNSTILTSTRTLSKGGMQGNIGTVSHEFFHAWNVERLRPADLEPFQFDRANMSGGLWFAEGFTSYYTNLLLCRAGIISPSQYVSRLAGGLNYVWNSTGTQYFNPIEMSYQAPFVDAARSVDPVNRSNTFISYYTYGSVLGLALDLSLRQMDQGLSLDGFLQLLWEKHGRPEIPYQIKDLENNLNIYTGNNFGTEFFQKYIYDSQMPNYQTIFSSVGVSIQQSNKVKPHFGASVRMEKKVATISSNPKKDGAAYSAGLEQGDKLLSINGKGIKGKSFDKTLNQFKAGDQISVVFERFGEEKTTLVTLQGDQSYQTSLVKTSLTEKQKARRDAWLGKK